jgi:hypothetical protein
MVNVEPPIEESLLAGGQAVALLRRLEAIRGRM